MHFDLLWLFSQLCSNCPLLTWWELIQDPSDMISGVLGFGMASFRLSYIFLLGPGVSHFSKWPGISWCPTRAVLKSRLGGFGPEELSPVWKEPVPAALAAHCSVWQPPPPTTWGWLGSGCSQSARTRAPCSASLDSSGQAVSKINLFFNSQTGHLVQDFRE